MVGRARELGEMRNILIVAALGLLSAVIYAREPNTEMVAQNEPTTVMTPPPMYSPPVPPRVMPGGVGAVQQPPTMIPPAQYYPGAQQPPPGVIPNQPSTPSIAVVPAGGPTLNPPNMIRPTIAPPVITGPPGSQH